MKEDIIHNIEQLFIDWYFKNCISSIQPCPWCVEEKDKLVNYCKEHIKEFKEFAEDTLEHPAEWCIDVARLCYELLPDVLPVNEEKTFNEKLGNLIKTFTKSAEWMFFQPCNVWLNYFKGTKDVDYYGDYAKYKDYLSTHYIPWKPNEEEDPNPTYTEFINNREKYK